LLLAIGDAQDDAKLTSFLLFQLQLIALKAGCPEVGAPLVVDFFEGETVGLSQGVSEQRDRGESEGFHV
jgi:hypothetical protein